MTRSHRRYSDSDSEDYGVPIAVVRTDVNDRPRRVHHRGRDASPVSVVNQTYLGLPERGRARSSSMGGQNPINIYNVERSPSRERRRHHRHSSSSSSGHRSRHRSSSKERRLREELERLRLQRDTEAQRERILREDRERRAKEEELERLRLQRDTETQRERILREDRERRAREEERAKQYAREQEYRKKEEEEKLKEMIAQEKLKEDAKKQREKEEKERAVAEWKMEQEKKKQEEKKKEEEAKEKMKQILREKGYSENSIDRMLDEKKKESSSTSTELALVESDHPRWIKVQRRYLHADTLDYYGLDWHYDDRDSDYIVIKKWIPQSEMDKLFAHSARIFKERKLLIDGPVIKETTTRLTPNDAIGRDGDGMYLVRRKSTGGRSRSTSRRRTSWFLT